MFDTKEAFLVDTLDYYLGDISERRCYLEGLGCFYSSKTTNKPNSEGCAIGRHIKDEETKKQLDIIGNISMVFTMGYQDLLPDWMVWFGERFLRDVQMFHDINQNWNVKSNKLSEAGKTHLKEIINTHGLNKSLFTKYL